MNTSAIPASVLASSRASAKPQQSDTNTTDISFNKILTREVADRHAAENANAAKTESVSSTNKQNEPSGTTSSSSTEDKNSSASDSVTEADGSVSAEQLLMMAAQFSPAIPPTAIAPATPSTPTDPLLTSDILKMTQDSTLQQLGKPELASAEQNPDGITDHAGLITNGFDATLRQAADKNRGLGADIKNEKNALTEVLQQSEEPLPKIASVLAQAAPVRSTIDLGADKTLDARPDLSATLAPLQQTITNQLQTAQGNLTDKLTPHVGTPAWNQAVGQKLVWMIGNEQQSASITLNPPDLGPLQVVLSVSSTQANASFYAAQPEVREALEAAMPKLREMLGDAGIQLGQANVSAGTPQQQGSYGEQQASSRSHNQTSDSALASTATDTNRTRITKEGLIDTFA